MPTEERINHGKELLAVLELAEQFPARHRKNIDGRFQDMNINEEHNAEPARVGNAVLKTMPHIEAPGRDQVDT